ncbi:MAG: hypothetical protein HXS46_04210 [Theionarchaea archaeon]|nr:MAG: hypothetical protein AYK18_08210 [Theionarchaea archaeon DG-70]MBU7009868.1 hypothetical protein [Theionarchaea archaeon]
MNRRLSIFIAGVFLLSLSSLCFEVSLSYQFGFMFWTNVSYVIVSIAMFGLGFGGILGYFLSKKKKYFEMLSYSAFIFALCMVFSLFLMARVSQTTFYKSLSLTYLQLLSGESLLFLIYFSLLPALPFFFAGIVLSSALNYPTESKREISYIYFGDLIGAGVGSFLVSLLVPALAVEGVVIFCSLVAVVSSLFFKRPSKKVGAVMVISLLLLGAAFFHRDALEPVPKKPLATYVEQGSKILYTEWSPTSRVDVVQFPSGKTQFIINGSYPVTILVSDYPYTKNEYDTRYFMFSDSPESVLAIGSGGGVELAMAVQAGALNITGVEINPVIMEMMLSEFKESSGDIYSQPNVTYVVEDGRTYVNRCNRTFDLIENGVLGADALILPSSIVQTFSDTYVYTVEANIDYWNHLTDDGVAVILVTSLMDEYNAVDAEKGVSYRLLRQWLTTAEALEDVGVSPEKHIIVFRHVMSSQYSSVLQPVYRQTDHMYIFKKELDEETVHSILERAKESEDRIKNYYRELKSPEADVFKFECLYAPFYDSVDFESYIDTIPESRDVSPTTDDHPYFYHTEKGAPFFLYSMLFVFLIFTFLFLVLPVAVKQRLEFESKLNVKLLPYFLLLGVGYILIQAVSIQRLTLFLGQPAYAFQVILFSMLVFSGAGSFITGKFKNEKTMVKLILLALVVVAFVYALVLSPLIYVLMPNPIAEKIGYAVVLLSPLYLLMGMPFPLGLRIVSREAEKDVIWMYAVNGGGSVIGSIIGMILAFSFGFSYAFAAGVVIYGCAFVIAAVWLS